MSEVLTHIVFSESNRAETFDAYWSQVPRKGETVLIDGTPHKVIKHPRWEADVTESRGRDRLMSPRVCIEIERNNW